MALMTKLAVETCTHYSSGGCVYKQAEIQRLNQILELAKQGPISNDVFQEYMRLNAATSDGSPSMAERFFDGASVRFSLACRARTHEPDGREVVAVQRVCSRYERWL